MLGRGGVADAGTAVGYLPLVDFAVDVDGVAVVVVVVAVRAAMVLASIGGLLACPAAAIVAGVAALRGLRARRALELAGSCDDAMPGRSRFIC